MTGGLAPGAGRGVVDASVGQRLLGLWEHYRGARTPLNVPVFHRLRGPVDVPALAAALDAVVARHEALRTRYRTSRRRLLQEVAPPAPAPLELREAPADPHAFEEEMRRCARTRLELSEGPLRATLWQVGPDEAVLLLTVHHLSTDGWSGGVLVGDLGRSYRPGGVPDAVAEPAWQYADFCAWQRSRMAEPRFAEHQRFWRERLAGTAAPRLPGAPADRTGLDPIPGTEHFVLPATTSAGLADLCRARRVTTFPAALAVFAAVLHARTGDRDFGLASMFANRSRPELAETVGFVANLLVLRMTVGEHPAFTDILDMTQDMVFDALLHQEVPYHMVPQAQGERGTGLENILFQVAAGPEYRLALEGLEVTQMDAPAGIGSRFDLEFALVPERDRMRGTVWFDRRRFSPEWIRALVADYTAMVDGVVADPSRPVREHVRPDPAESSATHRSTARESRLNESTPVESPRGR